VLERAATADLLISKAEGGLDGLPPGAHVGTSSVRRARQLQWQRPDLIVEEFRGNVQTRLRKLAQTESLSAIVLAEAGLHRLGFDTAAANLEFEGYAFHLASLAEYMFPAIGQGAIALQTRADREDVATIVRAINHQPTFTAIRAERDLQRLLSGDCTLPVGVRTEVREGQLLLSVRLFSDGEIEPRCAEAEGPADQPESVAGAAFANLSHTA
jgi:hydroxymethylbilane synthase